MTLLNLSLVSAALLVALVFRPWRQLAGGALLSPLLAALVITPWLWALPWLHHMPIQLQLSGACLVLLALGWPLAMLVFGVVALATGWIAPVTPAEQLDMALWLGVVPATLALSLGWVLRRALPHNLFVYILGRAFLGTAACLFATGDAVPARNRARHRRAGPVDGPRIERRRRARTGPGRALADGLGRRHHDRHGHRRVRGLSPAVAGNLVGPSVSARAQVKRRTASLRCINIGLVASMDTCLSIHANTKSWTMKLWQDLFGTDYGRMSIAGIAFMIGMAIWFVRFFIRKASETPQAED